MMIATLPSRMAAGGSPAGDAAGGSGSSPLAALLSLLARLYFVGPVPAPAHRSPQKRSFRPERNAGKTAGRAFASARAKNPFCFAFRATAEGDPGAAALIEARRATR
jgi:hypothetical protein